MGTLQFARSRLLSWAVRSILLSIAFFQLAPASGQSPSALPRLRIVGTQYDAQQRLRVQYTGDTNHYHTLLVGDAPQRTFTPIALALGTNELREAVSAPGAPFLTRFIRIAARPYTSADDADRDGIDDVYELTHGLNPLEPRDASEDPDRNGKTRLEEYLLSVGPLTQVETASPAPGDANVSVNREVVLRFTRPLAPNTLIEHSNLTVEAASRTLLSRLDLSPDRQTLTLFPLEPYPGSTRVRVRFNGAGLRDYLNRPLANSTNNGVRTFEFDTVPLTPIPGTFVVGQVLTETGARPIPGVLVQIDGAEQSFTTRTDTQGQFQFTNAPAGRFFARVDGRLATNGLPIGAYYPIVGKLWEAVPLQTNRVNGNGLVYLPLIQPQTLRSLSAVSETSVTFPVSVTAGRPELAGVELRVPANALFDNNGTRGGKVGIAPVSPDRLPEPLPPGLRFPLVITVQTDGAQNFDRAVPVRFPNLPDPSTGKPLPPGAKTALWSFNHDTGQWEIQGAMTISADGRFAESDPGVGVRQPGWHGAQTGSQLEMPEPAPGLADTTDGGVDPDAPREECSLDSGDWWDLSMSAYDCVRDTSAAFQQLGKVLDIMTNLKEIGSSLQEVREEYARTGDEVSLKKRLKLLKSNKDYLMSVYHVVAGTANPVDVTIDKINCAIGIVSTSTEKVCKGYDRDCYGVFWTWVCDKIVRLTGLIDAVKDLLERVKRAEATLFLDAICGGLDVLVAGLPAADAVLESDGRGSARPAAPNPGRLAGIDAVIRSWKGITDYQEALLPAVSQGDVVQQDLNEVRSGILDGVLIPGRALAGLWFRLVMNGEVIQRDRLNNSGRALFRVAANTAYRLEVYDPVRNALLVSEGLTPQIGQRGKTAPFVQQPLANSPDADADGLADAAEAVLGTDAQRPDSDGDGAADGLEVQRGTNPLDNRPARLGLVGSIPIAADTWDIAVDGGLAIVACEPPALAICDVSRPATPTLLAMLPLPESVSDLALVGRLAAVALGWSGVGIVDLAEPSAPRLLHRVGLQGRVDAVSLRGGLVAALTTIRVLAVGTGDNLLYFLDARRGTPFEGLSRAQLPWLRYLTAVRHDSGSTVLMDRWGSLGFLHPDPWNSSPLGDVDGRLGTALPAAPGRLGPALWLGNGRAYAGLWNGYDVYQIDTPAQPRVLGRPNQDQEAVHDLAWNGIDSLLAITSSGGPDTLRLSHYDASNPVVVSKLRTSFPLNGEPHRVALVGDHALVSSRSNGLQVVQYRVATTTPSTPSLRWISPTSAQALPPFQPFTAAIQVSSANRILEADFQLDDGAIITDRQFPFATEFLAPAVPKTGGQLRLRARVRDESGHQSDWTNLNVPVRHPTGGFDFQPVDELSGPPEANRRFLLYFTNPPDPTALAQNCVFTWYGPDQKLRTADDRVIRMNISEVDPWLRAIVLKPANNLPYGNYHVELGANVADLSGNKLGVTVPFDLAVDLLGYNSSGWRYRWILESETSDFHLPTEPPGFRDGTAAFGSLNSTCAAGERVRTDWPGGVDFTQPRRDLLARHTVRIPPGVTGVDVRLIYDDGVRVWFDGIELTNGLRRRSGCAVDDSLILTPPANLLKPGLHLLAIRANDRGGSAFLDARVTAWTTP